MARSTATGLRASCRPVRHERATFDSLTAFATCIGSLLPHEAIALGALRDDLPDQVEITTKARLEKLNGSAAPHLIARTADHIIYRPDQPDARR